MRGKTSGATAIAAVSLAAAALAIPAGATAGAPAKAAAAIPDLTTLLPEALKIVHKVHTLREAVLYEAEGVSRNNATFNTAAGVVGWHFIYLNQTPNSNYASATLDYGPAPKRFGKAVPVRQPFLEDQPIT